jgi:hypothetical protein
MARFRATIVGQRGEASRLGSAKSGLTARVNGWYSGIRVEAGVDQDGADRFEVFTTGGSNGSARDRHVGTVRMHPHGGHTWEPASG